MKNILCFSFLIIFLYQCSTKKHCKTVNDFYQKKYASSYECSGFPLGKGRNKIYKEYFKKEIEVDSSLIVIEQISSILGVNFANGVMIFVKDYNFDKQYKYFYNKDERFEIKNTTEDYGKTLEKGNSTTLDIILEKIKLDGFERVSELIRKNDGGTEGNTIITSYDKNLEIVNSIRLKRKLQFEGDLPPLPEPSR